MVAVKVIQQGTNFFNQGAVEVRMLDSLREPFSDHIVQMLDFFVYMGQLCIVFEELSSSLFETL